MAGCILERSLRGSSGEFEKEGMLMTPLEGPTHNVVSHVMRRQPA